MAKAAINKGVEVDLASGLQFEDACYAQVKERTEYREEELFLSPSTVSTHQNGRTDKVRI